MIVMERKIPERLAFYEVMMRRSLQSAKYESLYRKAKVGFDGELRLDREWKDIGTKGMFFHDFTCFNSAGHLHQIDTIYVCPHFVLVIESKHITGKLEFNHKTHQLIRILDNGEYEAFNDPVDQVLRHQQLLETHFLTSPAFIPVESAVIFTHPRCAIGTTHDEVHTFVVTGLRSKLNELYKQYQHIQLNLKAIRSSLEKLYRPVPFRYFGEIGPIRTGVLCHNCQEKMILTTHSFKCTSCNIWDIELMAVRQTLNDYRLIYGPSITNKQFREFAEIQHRSTAYNLLTRLLPERVVTKSNLSYQIPQKIYTPK